MTMTEHDFTYGVELDLEADHEELGMLREATPPPGTGSLSREDVYGQSHWDVDEPPVVVSDEDLRFLRRENRVAVARAAPAEVRSADLPPGTAAYHVPLLFVLHAHPECAFTYARLQVDLTPTPGSTVIDMSPREVQELPMEIESRRVVGLSFKAVPSVFDLSTSHEQALTQTMYVPTLTTSGVGFTKACWDFYPRSGYLHADQELHMLLRAPADTPVLAGLTVRAKVTRRGRRGGFPLLARVRDVHRPVHLAGPEPA